MRGVQFYDVLAGGNRTALTRPQIAGLFQAGQLGCNDPCKEAEQAEWRTIVELFPLLQHGTMARSLYQPAELHSPRGRVVAWTTAIAILVISAGSLAGYFAWRSGAHAANNSITAKAAANPAAPVSYTIENPYLLSPKARAEQERLQAAHRAQRAQAAKLAQERADAQKRERELQTAAGKTAHISPDQSARAATASPVASRKARR